jgi:hypothetical protein
MFSKPPVDSDLWQRSAIAEELSGSPRLPTNIASHHALPSSLTCGVPTDCNRTVIGISPGPGVSVAAQQRGFAGKCESIQSTWGLVLATGHPVRCHGATWLANIDTQLARSNRLESPFRGVATVVAARGSRHQHGKPPSQSN